jgi:histidinol-phosphate aminotransferase
MLACLRADLPAPGSFTVTEEPHTAKLDQNEAPVDLPDEVKRSLAHDLASRAWNRYPQPREYVTAKTRLADALAIAPDRVALTVGCDQVIQAAFLVAGGHGRRARWFEPTYPYINLASRVTGTIGEGIVLGEDVDERIDATRIVAAPTPHLVVLVSPNNPTGGVPSREALQAALADDGRLVFVDEAYHYFSNESVLDEYGTRPNLLVGRSLSKSLLAGVRLGYAIGHPEAIAAIERIYTAPYHLTSLQLIAAERYAELLPLIRSTAGMVVAECERLYAALSRMPGVSPRPSRANFVLFRVDGPAGVARSIHAALAQAGVRIRDVGGLPGMGEHLRVTAGTRGENDQFLQALRVELERIAASPPPAAAR